jgi:hypothetical protein
VINKDGLSFVSLYFKIRLGDSNDKCSSSLQAECWNEDETHAAQQSATALQRAFRLRFNIQPPTNLEYRNQLSGVCWGAVYCSTESIFLKHPVLYFHTVELYIRAYLHYASFHVSAAK